MTRKRIQGIFVVCMALAMTIVAARAQDYKSLLGKWNMTSETDGDPVVWTLVLKESDGRLTAALGTAEDAPAAKDFTYVDGALKFKVPYQGEYYDIELKANGEKLDGKWSGKGDSGKTSGVKSPSAATS
jgi:hypothetical protein